MKELIQGNDVFRPVLLEVASYHQHLEALVIGTSRSQQRSRRGQSGGRGGVGDDVTEEQLGHAGRMVELARQLLTL